MTERVTMTESHPRLTDEIERLNAKVAELGLENAALRYVQVWATVRRAI